jgi:branched-chain amino acid transport system substrate-binding protein
VDVRRRSQLLALGVAASVATVAGCTDDGPETTETTVLQTTTTVPAVVETDGRLTIGALIPGDDPQLSAALLDAVDSAIEQINDAGGVLDTPVRLIRTDEGRSTAAATNAIQSLIDDRVDAIIGPTSSLLALASLDEIVGDGVVACSPTASALGLDGFPDDGLFFRTIPSDSLQARAIAQVADQSGAQRAVIVHVDDAYGRGLATAVDASLTTGAIGEVVTVPISPAEDDLAADMQRVVDSEAQVAIVLADAEDGPRFLAALDEIDTDGLATVVVNDAMRDPGTPETIADLGPELRDKIIGLAPQAEPTASSSSAFVPTGPFASNAYDCANLIALAAERAGSDAPRAIADNLANVSASGSLCTTFAECRDSLAAGLQIDYNGPSGVTDLLERTGDPQRAVFDRFRFDASGASVTDRPLLVSS